MMCSPLTQVCPDTYTQIAYHLVLESKRLHACMRWQIINRVSAVQQRVREHSEGENGYKWEGCQVFKDYHEMLEKTSKDKKPDAMIIGVPPWLHGMHCCTSLNRQDCHLHFRAHCPDCPDHISTSWLTLIVLSLLSGHRLHPFWAFAAASAPSPFT